MKGQAGEERCWLEGGPDGAEVAVGAGEFFEGAVFAKGFGEVLAGFVEASEDGEVAAHVVVVEGLAAEGGGAGLKEEVGFFGAA